MGSYYSKTTFEEFTIREKDTKTVADKNAYIGLVWLTKT